jgi:NADPH-dependent 2,4-dienoyl-CoA reductase/sulfur reductase-like enzyme
MSRMRLVIVGGSDAAVSAALRARELAPDTEVLMVLEDRYPNYSICGIPFYLSGEVPDWRSLAHRTRDEIEQAGIQVMTDTKVVDVDPAARHVTAESPAGPLTLAYDRLVLATGAVPIRPPLEGLDRDGVFLLHSMDDSFRLAQYLATRGPRSAVIVGAGYIGCEMAEALRHRGLAVTMIEQAEAVLPTVDPPLGRRLGARMTDRGVRLVLGATVAGIDAGPGDDGALSVRTTDGASWPADVVLVVVGVRPEATLAERAGIARGARGAIVVSRTMATSAPDVWAAGDCVETWHRVLERSTYLPLGTTAHKQGRVAGENAVGGNRVFEGALGTQVVKVFDAVVARTGLRDQEARAAGFEPVTVEFTTWDHKVYYPGARSLYLRLTGDKPSGRLLGAQVLGELGSEVAKRVDIVATALHHRMTVDALSDLDLSYTPPLSSPWDPVQMAAQEWCRMMAGHRQ